MPDKMFKAFEIDHLSASSINKWTGDRGAWVALYVFGLKGEVGPAAWRGGAVEDGLTAYVTRSNVDPLTYSMMTFERDAKGDLDEAVEKERQLIAPMRLKPWTRRAPQRGRARPRRPLRSLSRAAS